MHLLRMNLYFLSNEYSKDALVRLTVIRIYFLRLGAVDGTFAGEEGMEVDEPPTGGAGIW